MGDHREFERTLTAAPEWRVPDLAQVRAVQDAGVAAAVELDPVDLDAVYHDTEDLRLLRHGVTLRRRTGDAEPGWHLKIPAGDGSRTELQHALDPDASPLDDAPPPAFAGLVTGIACGLPLAPVARLTTQRAQTDLRDPDGVSLATIADDAVRVSALVGAPRETGWREIEVEATGGDDALVEEVADVLRRSGATPAPSIPKLARALDVAVPFAGAESVPPAPPDDATAAEVVAERLRLLVAEMLRLDLDVRRDQPDAVHRARVVTRKLRALLAAYRPLLDTDVSEPLRAEFGWWRSVLATARDAEVRRDRLVEAIGALPDGQVMGHSREDLVAAADLEYRQAWRIAVEKASGPRYLAMLRRAEALATDPPFTDRAHRAADRQLRRALAREWMRVEARHAAAADADEAHRDPLLHAERKAAKRARYAAEAAAPVLGERAERLARRLDAVEDALGVHHDALVLAESLRRSAALAPGAREPSFTHGVLAAGEASRARHALEDHARAWRRLARRRTVGWLED